MRLAANSRITITKKIGKSIEVSLETGDLWARVLKPLYDTSFFTVKAADVSAGVQGTSIRVKKATDKLTITVVDSYSSDASHSGATVTGNGISVHIPTEHSLEIDLTKGSHHDIPQNKDNLFRDEFIRDNTKHDLVYMESLQQATQDIHLRERLAGEFQVTMPTSHEISSFFDETKLRDKIGKKLIDSRQPFD